MALAKKRVAAKKQKVTRKSRNKSSKKKAHGGRILIPSVPIVGIVTSIDFTGNPLAQAFCDALRQGGWEFDPTQPAGNRGRVILDFREALGAYGPAHKELDDAVKDLNANSNVKVIVAAGGLPTAEVVARLSKKPYLVLIGTTPSSFNLDPNTWLRGGVNLGNPQMNAARNQALQAAPYGVAPNRVCLIYNDNNKELSQLELNPWQTNGWPAVPGTKGGNNKTSDFATAVTDAKAVADAVVISSDAFFTEKRNQLVQALSNPGGNPAKTLFACYPFQIYGTANPIQGRSIWLGPDLPAAYSTLGSKAGLLLIDSTTQTGLDAPVAPLGPTPF
jgi:hypothetical protein